MGEDDRLFFWGHELLAAAPYDCVGEPGADFHPYVAVAPRFRSGVITIDVARTAAGTTRSTFACRWAGRSPRWPT